MASTRRRFLMSAAAMGGVGLARPAAWNGPAVPPKSPPDTFSPAELLERHERETALAAGNAAPAQQSDPRMPTQAEVDSWYTDRRNWGRWGRDDQMGALNLITPQKRTAAAALVRNGHTVSMSRVFEPSQHFMRKNPRADTGAGAVVDYYGFIYHGQTITHIDALCHMWDKDGMWQGRDPDIEVNTRGAHFGAITAWSGGIITKGVPHRRAAPPRRAACHAGAARPWMGDRRNRPRPRRQCRARRRPPSAQWPRGVRTPRQHLRGAGTARGCTSPAPSSFATTTWRCSAGT